MSSESFGHELRRTGVLEEAYERVAKTVKANGIPLTAAGSARFVGFVIFSARANDRCRRKKLVKFGG